MAHTVGPELKAIAVPHWFDGGEVQGFTIPNGHFKMCFLNPINKLCKGLSGYCGKNCTQHSMDETVIKLNSTWWLVNFRMLEPSTTEDKAYVIRVYNNTIVYMVEGHCPVKDNLYKKWSPKLLLQRPNNTLETSDTSRGKNCMF